MSESEVQNMMAAIYKLNLVEFIKDYDQDGGFMFSSDNRVSLLGNEVACDGHSGASFAYTLRRCQYFLNNPEVNTTKAIERPETPIDGAGSDYVFYEAMDNNNKKAMDVFASKGPQEAIKHMFTREDGTTCSYSEMREKYG